MNIGQASKASAVGTKLIRYYESIGLIPEAGRTASGYRVYTPQEVNVLKFIKRARTLGFSIEQIEKLVGLWRDRDRPSKEVKRIALEHVEELERKIAQMQAMSETLKELARACRGDHRPDCPILRDLEIGEHAHTKLGRKVTRQISAGHTCKPSDRIEQTMATALPTPLAQAETSSVQGESV